MDAEQVLGHELVVWIELGENEAFVDLENSKFKLLLDSNSGVYVISNLRDDNDYKFYNLDGSLLFDSSYYSTLVQSDLFSDSRVFSLLDTSTGDAEYALMFYGVSGNYSSSFESVDEVSPLFSSSITDIASTSTATIATDLVYKDVKNHRKFERKLFT